TGRLSLDAHPWLADHVVAGRVVVPGTALLELALRAAREVGCRQVEELVLEAPLVLPQRDSVHLQISVGAKDESGRCTVSVHSRADDAAETADWRRNAHGTLADTASVIPAGQSTWPPAGAEEVGIETLYGDLADAGLLYGHTFRGLRKVWRRGDEIFADVRLPEDQHGEADAYGIHPALLDTALHAAACREAAGDDAGGRLPFSWRGVVPGTPGATEARVHLSRSGADAMTVALTDVVGRPLFTAESLALRPLSTELFDAPPVEESLFRVEWTPITPTAAPETPAVEWYDDLAAAARRVGESEGLPSVIAVRITPDQVPDAARVHERVTDALAFVQAVLGLPKERAAGLRVVIATSDADLAVSGVWGLVRSAQSEHPGRFVLVDADAGADAGVGGG
ncbi:polyketide synthase dehydratase domain-containing protein, partial [Streptomyces sp. NPDC048612]|uniref:polyketide synthase dehydratase domain-containing protein n=1 Tax=Streptomyces sp. NPDC048612 TaxID=3365579 RepID=UPI0037138A2F